MKTKDFYAGRTKGSSNASKTTSKGGGGVVKHNAAVKSSAHKSQLKK